MHKVDQTVLDAVGIYEAQCEAAGAPKCEHAKIVAVQKALETHVAPNDLTMRLMELVEMRAEGIKIESAPKSHTARKPRGGK